MYMLVKTPPLFFIQQSTLLTKFFSCPAYFSLGNEKGGGNREKGGLSIGKGKKRDIYRGAREGKELEGGELKL